MKLVKRVKCKLQITEQVVVFWGTFQRFASACDGVLGLSQEKRTTDKVRLQHLCYREIGGKYSLQANLVIRAVVRVSEVLKKKPKQFKTTSTNLDRRTFSFKEKRWEGSISTVAGRFSLLLAIGDFQPNLSIRYKPTSAILYSNERKKEFYANIVLSREVLVPSKVGDDVGGDRGIYNLSVILAVIFNSLKFCRKADHIHAEKMCQTAGNAPSQEHGESQTPLETAFGKEAPLGGQSQPRCTGQRCPRCSSTNRSSRRGHLFHCGSCGFVGHADIIAADDIRQVYLESLTDGSLSVDPKAATNAKPTTSVVSN